MNNIHPTIAAALAPFVPQREGDPEIGQRFGRLTVVAKVKSVGGAACFSCRCDCGTERVVRGGELRSGDTRSCGCLRREVTSATKGRHRMRQTSEYATWCAMKARCSNPNNKRYANYGARGISVCERWLNSFDAFYADMGQRPSPQHSIDRIDNEQGYGPENCRWATASQQSLNRRPRTRRVVRTDESCSVVIEDGSVRGAPVKEESAAVSEPVQKHLFGADQPELKGPF